MTRRILIELALFLTPFAIFWAYRAMSKDMSVKDRWPMTILVASGGVLAVGALVIVALLEPSTRGLCYQPIYEIDGERIGGDMRECDEIITPEYQGANSAAQQDVNRLAAESDPEFSETVDEE